MAELPAAPEALLHEPGADPLPLVSVEHGNGGEGKGRDAGGCSFNPDPAEGDVPGHPAVSHGDEGEVPDEPRCSPDRLDDVHLDLPPECGAVELRDGLDVPGLFRPDVRHGPGTGADTPHIRA